MEWCRISTSTELVRVDTDRIVYVRADGNYSDFVQTNDKAKRRALTYIRLRNGGIIPWLVFRNEE